MRPDVPTVVVICGPPCSGKTTIARQLQTELAGFAYFEMDEIRLSIWPGIHTPEVRLKAYGHMHEKGGSALRDGAPGVILVATYQPSEQRRALRRRADAASARLVLFECSVAADMAAERFRQRSGNHAATDLWAERVWDLAPILFS
jgi:predicted kinase